MNEQDDLPEALKDLVDAYLDGVLDEAGNQELETRLRLDAAALRYFVRYCRLQTDLCLETRARRAEARVLDALGHAVEGTGAYSVRPSSLPLPGPGSLKSGFTRSRRRLTLGAVAAALLGVVVVGSWLMLREEGGRPTPPPAVAWLVNGQNCKWTEGVEPGGDLHAGARIRLERGLVELRFGSGARIVLEGSADLELLSANSARLRHGKLAARVPNAATGFSVLLPRGKVIDLGTEFGVAVADDGATDVFVFEGRVEAHTTEQAGKPVFLKKDQAARLDERGVLLQPEGVQADTRPFVRAIVPPPVLVHRTLTLDFRQAVQSAIRDAAGHGTGLTHRLPGTGRHLPVNDPNLTLDLAKGCLELLTTNSDLNTQFRLNQGEYIGVRLANLGFTGPEDFEVTATLSSIPALQAVGQFGLYAGVRSDRNIRGGLIGRKEGEYTQFLVHNNGGRDADLYQVGLLSRGNDLRLALKRSAGKYALAIENLTTGAASTLTLRPSEFLKDAGDLYVGLFGANTQSEVRRPLVVKEFKVTVWTSSP